MVAKFTYFSVPSDPEYRQALGLVAIRHAHLDRILQMTIKTLARVTAQQALNATAFQGSKTLRERILKLAGQQFGEGSALVQTQDLMRRCGELTDRRNHFMHSVTAKELDGPLKLVTHARTLALPSASRLSKLAEQLAAVTAELNHARLEGFIAEALKKRQAKTSIG